MDNVEVDPPHHHEPTGHRWLDKVLPISALFVSMVSIGIAWHHSEIMVELVDQNERLVEANSLPYLGFEPTININNREDSDSPRSSISVIVNNSGVGPAEIRFSRYLYNGQPYELMDLLEACCDLLEPVNISRTDLTYRMMRPGDEIVAVELRSSAETQSGIGRFIEAWTDNEIVLETCYCSVFDECWMHDSEAPRPTPIASCPAIDELTD